MTLPKSFAGTYCNMLNKLCSFFFLFDLLVCVTCLSLLASWFSGVKAADFYFLFVKVKVLLASTLISIKFLLLIKNL